MNLQKSATHSQAFLPELLYTTLDNLQNNV